MGRHRNIKKLSEYEYKLLIQRLDTSAGIKCKLDAFEKRMIKMEVQLTTIMKDNKMLREKIIKLSQYPDRTLIRKKKDVKTYLGIRWIEL